MADTRDNVTDLEAELLTLGRHLDYPATPDIAAGVRDTLAAQPAPIPLSQARLSRTRRWAVLAAAGVLVLLVTALAVVPTSRNAIADRLGLRGADIVITPTAVVPTPDPTGQRLLLGDATTIDAAVPELTYQPFLPPSTLGTPDTVYLLEPPVGGQLSYVYLTRPGMPAVPQTGVAVLISQFRGDTNESFIAKQLGDQTSLAVVDVNGEPGFWIEGAPHVFAYEDASGEFQQESLRLAANVLIWESDGITLRIESALSLDESLAIADSMTR
jgi:hypothetical protein